MKYTLTMQTDDAQELADLLASIAAHEGDGGDASNAERADKPRRRRRTKAEIEADEAAARAEAKTEPKAEAKPETVPPSAPAPKAEGEPAGTLDYVKDVRPKIMEASQSKDVGMDKVVELLAKYGAKRGQDIPVDKLPAFLADLSKLGQPAESKADDGDDDGDLF